MISIDINHPDVLDFITIKRDLSKVTGANISIKLNDDFMKAVEANSDYNLRFPVDVDVKDAETVLTVKAKNIWDEIIKSAHSVAEPGLMFWNSMVYNSPDGVYEQYKPVTTNP